MKLFSMPIHLSGNFHHQRYGYITYLLRYPTWFDISRYTDDNFLQCDSDVFAIAFQHRQARFSISLQQNAIHLISIKRTDI